MYRSTLDLSKSKPDPASPAKVVVFVFPGNGIGLHNVASVFLLGKSLGSARKAYLRLRLFAECSPTDKTGYVDSGGEAEMLFPVGLALAPSEPLTNPQRSSIPTPPRRLPV
jgi:hypothetical protein